MSKPIFFFVGAYDHVASAEGDYEVMKILRSTGELGAYDAAVIAKRDGEVQVHKAERPTEERTWIGLAATVWFGRVSRAHCGLTPTRSESCSREGRAALIVVGIEEDAGRIEQTAVQAIRSTLRHLPDADFDASERDAVEAMARA